MDNGGSTVHGAKLNHCSLQSAENTDNLQRRCQHLSLFEVCGAFGRPGLAIGSWKVSR